MPYLTTIPVPDVSRSVLAVSPPEPAAGFWAGGPSACVDVDDLLLAYRVRRPVGDGRGYGVVVARWPRGALAGADAVPQLEIETVLGREDFASDSLERPALRRRPDGGWALWISASTPGTAHWRIDLLEAAEPSRFRAADARTVLTGVPSGGGHDKTAVKDCVVLHHEGAWWMWACVHPLEDPQATDRHWTDLLHSADGVDWQYHGTVLTPRPGHWDARGTRATAALVGTDGNVLLAYDGRASAARNYAEQTGFATGSLTGTLTPVGDEPAAVSPYGDGALRYLEVVTLPSGDLRLFFEAANADGAHELRTQLLPGPAAG